MSRFLFPLLGIVLGVIGTFGPFSVAPAGGALSLCAILGLMMLMRVRGPRTHEIRNEAFWHGVGVAGALTLGAAFLMWPAESAQAWMTPAIVYSALAGLGGFAITAVFVIRVRRALRKPDTRKSRLRTALLSSVVALWALMSVAHAGFGLVYATAYLMTDLTPPVNAVAMAYAQDPSGFLSTARLTDKGLSVQVSGTDYVWGCGGERGLTVAGLPVSTIALDDRVLVKICEAVANPPPFAR